MIYKLNLIITNIFRSTTNKNLFWLMIDRFFRLGLGFFITIFVARYLGPDYFGKWNYSVAIISLLSILSTFGMSQAILKFILSNETPEHIILGTAFFMRLMGSILASILSCLYIYISQDDKIVLTITFIASMTLWFQPFDIIELKFQSILASRKSVIVKGGAFFITSFLKLFVVFYKMPFILIIICTSLEFFIGAIGLLSYYGLNNFINWKFDFNYFKVLVKYCWPLTLSGVFVMFYMRLDQVMIGNMIGTKAVGFYSISTRFTELFYFIPSLFVTSFLPKIVSSQREGRHKYLDSCLSLSKTFFIISLSISIFFYISSDYIINILYGLEYSPAVFSLKISVWTGIFVFWGVASGNMLLMDNMNHHGFKRSFQGLILNALLNIFLIPIYGINGAACATLISQFYASYVYLFLFKETRYIFILQTKSILFFKKYNHSPEFQ